MFIDNLNLNHIRIFEGVFRTKSMTKAAEELHMTQSGVSQHIKHLEEILGVVLFDRIKQRLIATENAAVLYKTCSESLFNIEKALADIKGVEQRLIGTITLGVPIEFGNSFVIPLLSEFGKQNPGVKFKIKYGFASEMNDLILDGSLDFAFVDSYRLDKHITTCEVFRETLHLCASVEFVKSEGGIINEKKFLSETEYVDYMDDEPVLKMWFKHHFRQKNMKLKMRAHLMDVQGVGNTIASGLAAGILPLHHINKLEALGHKFYIFRENHTPLKNSISMAYLENRTKTPSVLKIMDYLKDNIKEKDSETGFLH